MSGSRWRRGPAIEFRTDDRLRLGESGIQARLVRPPSAPRRRPSQGDHGHTAVYTVSDRLAEPLREPDPRRGRRAHAGRRAGASCWARAARCSAARARADVRGRRPERLAPSRRGPALGRGSWIVRDLGSTNGVKVNGRRIQGPQSLKRGDVIELGTARVTFELE